MTAAFYAFYAFSAIVGSVSYGIMEGLKVQVPPPASLWKRLSQRISNESGAEPVSPPARQPSKPEWAEVADGLFCKLLAVDAETGRVTMLSVQISQRQSEEK